MSKFVEGKRYEGEYVHGGCGVLEPLSIIVLKRNADTINYELRFGRAVVRQAEAKIQFVEKWGEYIEAADDRFFAYAEYH